MPGERALPGHGQDIGKDVPRRGKDLPKTPCAIDHCCYSLQPLLCQGEVIVGHRLLFVALLLMALAVCLTACRVSADACSSTTTECSTPTAAAPASLTAAQILDAAQHANLRSAAFSGPITLRMDGSVVSGMAEGRVTTAPDRQESTVSVTRGALGLTSTQIESGTATYVKALGGDIWSKASRHHPFVTLSYDGLQHPVLLGSDTLDGVTTYHIQGQGTNDQGQTYQVDYWFRQSDFYPVRAVLDSPDGDLLSYTLTYSDWDSTITVPLPALSVGEPPVSGPSPQPTATPATPAAPPPPPLTPTMTPAP
jgi:hypothetical protein